MLYRRRELRRLWKVEIFDIAPGETPNEDTSTRAVTVVAWNRVDAIRGTGSKAAKQPEPLFFVTFPDAEDNIYRINSPQEGPIGDPVVPSVIRTDEAAENW